MGGVGGGSGTGEGCRVIATRRNGPAVGWGAGWGSTVVEAVAVAGHVLLLQPADHALSLSLSLSLYLYLYLYLSIYLSLYLYLSLSLPPSL